MRGVPGGKLGRRRPRDLLRHAEEVALRGENAFGETDVEILRGLHPLGDERNGEVARHARQHLQDGTAAAVPSDPARDGAVHFDPARRELETAPEGPVARRDVVEHDAHAEIVRHLESGPQALQQFHLLDVDQVESQARVRESDALGLATEDRELAFGGQHELRVDVQEEERFSRQPRGGLERERPGEPLEGAFDAQRPRRGKNLRRGADGAVGVPGAQQRLVAEGLARAQIENRLKNDEEAVGPQHVQQPERAHQESRGRKRHQVPDRVPFRVRGILRRDPDLLRQGAEARLEMREQALDPALDKEAARPPIDLRARPRTAHRQRNSAFGLGTVGPEEKSPRLPPAIKSAESLAVQNAFGEEHL